MEHALAQMTITVGAPPEIAGEEGRQRLAHFYGELLGMQVIRQDWLKIAVDPESALHLALDGDGWSDQRPPRWQDPEFPQQMHLDLFVRDVVSAGGVVEGLGGRLLRQGGDRRVYADPAGHPFCLYPGPDLVGGPAVIGRLVLDCFSPRSLATFYEGVFGARRRPEDAPTRVMLALDDDRFPDLAFQHAQFVAPRWPDPAFPAQLHLDLPFADRDSALQRAETLGGIRLPRLADSEVFADPAGHPFCL